MSIRKLKRTNKALAGYEIVFDRNTLVEECKFVSDIGEYDVEIKYTCSMGVAKANVYVNSEVVIRYINKEYGL